VPLYSCWWSRGRGWLRVFVVAGGIVEADADADDADANDADANDDEVADADEVAGARDAAAADDVVEDTAPAVFPGCIGCRSAYTRSMGMGSSTLVGGSCSLSTDLDCSHPTHTTTEGWP
jgi:hypothetical protein